MTAYLVQREFTDDRQNRRFFPTGIWEGEDPEAADRLVNGEITDLPLPTQPAKLLKDIPYPASAAEPRLTRKRAK